MIRRVDALTDAHVKERREITVTGRLAGDWTSSRGTHVLLVEVPASAEVEIGGTP